MTFLAAPVWNQIAREQTLETEAARLAFRLNPEQLARMDDLWMQAETQAGTPETIARCLPTCLPLLLEAPALGQFVSQHPTFRSALPEMLDAQEATFLMTADYRLTPDEQATLTSILSSPQSAAARWLQAAQLAMQA
jgi:hypothetical protein